VETKIYYEDNHIIVIEKQPGLLSQGDISGTDSLLEILKDYIREKYNKPGNVFLGLVHRLDLPVSGVMVFARTSKSAQRLSEQFAKKTVSKYYVALVEAKRIRKTPYKPDSWNRVENYTFRKGDRTFIADKGRNDAKLSTLHFYPLHSTDSLVLVLIKLETGRKHQIRAQMANLMGPVSGDKKYGSTTEMGNTIALHSCFLSFNHPTTKERMSFFSEIPGRLLKPAELDRNKIRDRIMKIISHSDGTG